MSLHYYEYLAKERLQQLYQEPEVRITPSCTQRVPGYGRIKSVSQFIRGILSRVRSNLPDRERRMVSPVTNDTISVPVRNEI